MPKVLPGVNVASNRTSRGIAQLLRTVCAHDADGPTDGQLLEQFRTSTRAVEMLT